MTLLHGVILTVLVSWTNCCDLERFFSEKQVSVEESASTSRIVFRGFTIASEPAPNDLRGVSTAYFELINTYKGAETLEAWGANNYRYVTRGGLDFGAKKLEKISVTDTFPFSFRFYLAVSPNMTF
jgi:hypothetical protein